MKGNQFIISLNEAMYYNEKKIKVFMAFGIWIQSDLIEINEILQFHNSTQYTGLLPISPFSDDTFQTQKKKISLPYAIPTAIHSIPLICHDFANTFTH